ncbi:UspA [Dillenia turbinata]|uniref:UspA n=1 Tax=Dillenia turbinata TaxID=194707 RepID=A0AAN8V816_9MAGN
MEVRKIVVVVEDVEVARTALKWALHNLCRCDDIITLLHVYSNSTRSKSKKKIRLLRLKGFQLALSFKDICNPFPNAKVDIVVTEGDPDGKKIASMVREMGASTLVVGLHDRSFLYKIELNLNSKPDKECLKMVMAMVKFGWSSFGSKFASYAIILPTKTKTKAFVFHMYRLATAHNNVASNFNCKVLAIKQPPPPPRPSTAKRTTATAVPVSSTNLDFSQVEIAKLVVPDTPPPRIPYRICPNPSLIIWRSRKTRRRRSC